MPSQETIQRAELLSQRIQQGGQFVGSGIQNIANLPGQFVGETTLPVLNSLIEKMGSYTSGLLGFLTKDTVTGKLSNNENVENKLDESNETLDAIQDNTEETVNKLDELSEDDRTKFEEIEAAREKIKKPQKKEEEKQQKNIFSNFLSKLFNFFNALPTILKIGGLLAGLSLLKDKFDEFMENPIKVKLEAIDFIDSVKTQIVELMSDEKMWGNMLKSVFPSDRLNEVLSLLYNFLTRTSTNVVDTSVDIAGRAAARFGTRTTSKALFAGVSGAPIPQSLSSNVVNMAEWKANKANPSSSRTWLGRVKTARNWLDKKIPTRGAGGAAFRSIIPTLPIVELGISGLSYSSSVEDIEAALEANIITQAEADERIMQERLVLASRVGADATRIAFLKKIPWLGNWADKTFLRRAVVGAGVPEGAEYAVREWGPGAGLPPLEEVVEGALRAANLAEENRRLSMMSPPHLPGIINAPPTVYPIPQHSGLNQPDIPVVVGSGSTSTSMDPQ